MSMMEFIRKHYGVPAKAGARVETDLGKGQITRGSLGGRLRIRLDGETKSRIFHPLSVDYHENKAT